MPEQPVAQPQPVMLRSRVRSCCAAARYTSSASDSSFGCSRRLDQPGTPSPAGPGISRLGVEGRVLSADLGWLHWIPSRHACVGRRYQRGPRPRVHTRTRTPRRLPLDTSPILGVDVVERRPPPAAGGLPTLTCVVHGRSHYATFWRLAQTSKPLRRLLPIAVLEVVHERTLARLLHPERSPHAVEAVV